MEKSRVRAFKWWQFHHALWRYKFLVVFTVCLGTAVAFLYTSSVPKQYKSTASAMLDAFSSSNTMSTDFSPSNMDFSKAHRYLAENVNVIEKAKVKSGLPKESFESAAFEARVDGVLIYLTVIDGDKNVAANLANAWVEAFIEELNLRIRKSFDNNKSSLDEQIHGYQVKLEEVNSKQMKFYNENKFDPESFKTDDIHNVVSHLDNDRADKKNELIRISEEIKIIRDEANFEDPALLTQLGYIDKDLTFKDRFSWVKECEKKLADIKIQYLDNSLEVSRANEQLKQAKLLLNETRRKLGEALEMKKNALAGELARVEDRYKIKRDELDMKQLKANEYKSLSTEAESIKRSLDYVSERLREVEVEQRSKHLTVVRWEAAQASFVPFKPVWRQNIGVGFMLSFILACALIFALEQIDDTVRTPHDLESRLNARVLGAVPACGRYSLDREGYFLAQRQSASIAVDSMRGIHIALEVGRGKDKRTGALMLCVTSAVPQDGKSFVASNLAILFASLGRRVLVVDADLRKASLSKALEFDKVEGFFEVIKSLQWTPRYIQNSKTPGYSLLPAGLIRNSVSESLNPESIVKITDEMRKDFDVILFDTPPVLALPDACVLGQVCDVTILVTRSRHTRIAQAERAASSLISAKVKNLYFIVNGVDAVDAASETYGAGYGYGYGYGYGSGYGYGYGRDTKVNGAAARMQKSIPAKVTTLDDEDEDDPDEDDDELTN